MFRFSILLYLVKNYAFNRLSDFNCYVYCSTKNLYKSDSLSNVFNLRIALLNLIIKLSYAAILINPYNTPFSSIPVPSKATCTYI